MSLWDRLSNIFKAKDAPPGYLAPVIGSALDARIPISAPADYWDFLSKYVGWVYVCASRNAETVAAQPMRLYAPEKEATKLGARDAKAIDRRRCKSLATRAHLATKGADRSVEITSHPFLDVWNNINPIDEGFSFVEGLQLYQELTGNAFIWRDEEMDVPTELWPLNPAFMQANLSSRTVIDSWSYGWANRETWSVDAVAQFKMPNPQHPVWGAGPLQAARLSQDAAIIADKYTAGLLSNWATPPIVFFPKDEGVVWSEDQVRAAMKMWDERYKGVDKAGRPAFLRGGIDMKVVGISPKDLLFLDLQKFGREQIAAIFGVPVSMLTTESVNRANAEAGIYQYMRFTIKPRLARFEQKMNQSVLPWFDPTGQLFVAFDDPVPEDREFLLNRQKVLALVPGAITPNEIRAEWGMDPLPGGDDPIKPAPPPTVPGNDGMDELPAKDDDDNKSPCPPVSIRRKAIDIPMSREDAELRDILLAFFTQQENEILAEVAATRGAKDAAWRVIRLNEERWSKILGDSVRGTVQGIFFRSAAEAQRTYNLAAGIGFDVANRAAIAAVDKTIRRFAKSVNRTTGKAITASVEQAIADGWTMDQLRAAIAETYTGAKRHRAEAIARTETARAVSAGTEEVFSQGGIAEKEWLAAGDGCEFCMAMNGRKVAVGEAYIKDGGSLTGTLGGAMTADFGDVDGPPVHPNCRCVIVPVV